MEKNMVAKPEVQLETNAISTRTGRRGFLYKSIFLIQLYQHIFSVGYCGEGEKE